MSKLKMYINDLLIEEVELDFYGLYTYVEREKSVENTKYWLISQRFEIINFTKTQPSFVIEAESKVHSLNPSEISLIEFAMEEQNISFSEATRKLVELGLIMEIKQKSLQAV